MESSEDSIDFDAQLQVLENDPDDPLHLCRVGLLDEVGEVLGLVGGTGEQVEDVVEPFDSKSRVGCEITFDDVVHADREVTNAHAFLMVVGVLVMIEALVLLLA